MIIILIVIGALFYFTQFVPIICVILIVLLCLFQSFISGFFLRRFVQDLPKYEKKYQDETEIEIVVDKIQKIKKKIQRKFEALNFKIFYNQNDRVLQLQLKLKPKSQIGEDWSPRVQLQDKNGPLLTEERPLQNDENKENENNEGTREQGQQFSIREVTEAFGRTKNEIKRVQSGSPSPEKNDKISPNFKLVVAAKKKQGNEENQENDEEEVNIFRFPGERKSIFSQNKTVGNKKISCYNIQDVISPIIEDIGTLEVKIEVKKATFISPKNFENFGKSEQFLLSPTSKNNILNTKSPKNLLETTNKQLVTSSFLQEIPKNENQNFENSKILEKNNSDSSIGNESRPCIEQLIQASIPPKSKDFGRSTIFVGSRKVQTSPHLHLSRKYGNDKNKKQKEANNL